MIILTSGCYHLNIENLQFGLSSSDALKFVYYLMYQDRKSKRQNEPIEEKKESKEEERKSTLLDSSTNSMDTKLEHFAPTHGKISFLEDASQTHPSANAAQKSRSLENQYPRQARSIRQQAAMSFGKKEELRNKRVLMLYTSGSSGANQNIQIRKGFLKARIKENQYLCDEKIMQHYESEESLLITPEQENGIRIFYEVEEFPKIDLSINISLEDIKNIAIKIEENYKKFDAFIILCGFDVICYISTFISFMLENLSKLIIFTGGYFPIAYMRNDTVNNINESFSIISFADNFNDVIIVCKNKGYRANRTLRITEGSFASVSSPNIEPLVSVNIKIKFREYLYLPVPTQQFSIWTNVSCRVGIIKFHILLNSEALQHELANPAFDGFVIESYGSSNLPLNQQILEVFKRAAEQKNKIFVNVAQPVKKVNSSIMKDQLEKYYIYFGGDMTTEAALSKLSYLLSKKYSRAEIKKLIYTNMRGELTEMKVENQFQIENPSFMELVEDSLLRYYPSNLYQEFIHRIEDEAALFVSNCSNSKSIQQIFKNVKNEKRQELFKSTMERLIDANNLLHRAVQASNQNLYKYFLSFSINCNKEDESECSPLFYAIILKDKKAIQYLSRKGCQVICHEDDLFDLFIRELKKDNASFFELLYHIEFKQTLKDLSNYQGRNVLHLAALLRASKSLRYILQKFKFNLKQRDSYGKIYTDYIAVK